MVRVELSEAADRDLAGIYRYTFQEYGERQADCYLASLEERLQSLADRPLVARSAERLRAGYRCFEHASHVIFFVQIDGGIRVIRVLHSRMDPERHL